MVDVEKISVKQREILEKAWKIIEDIASARNEPDVFYKNSRSKLIIEAAAKYNVSEKYIYRYLSKYWKGGKVKQALLPDLSNCGAKGKERQSDKKLGRPNLIAKQQPEKAGVNITNEDKKIFEKALKRYLKAGKKISLRKIYDLMVTDFYTHYIEQDEEIMPIAQKNWLIPTEYQFRNWYYGQRDIKKDIIAKKGEREFMLNHDKVCSNTIYETFGPGYRYQIDSTIPGVYLINRIVKDRGIGKPIVYYVTDVFSRLIVGIYVGLNNPSWECASSALYNCIEDKVEFCRRFGLKITSDKWPNTTLPRILMSDRGELAGDIVIDLLSCLNIHVETTRSYMGKDKPVVEQDFRTSEIEYLPLISGSIEQEIKKRGVRDYRKDAALDINEFTKIVLAVVIRHNNKKIEDYPMTQKMIDDKVYPTPANIWNWGLQNISGNTYHTDLNLVKLYLMRQGIATITKKGISFGDYYYDSEICNKENWYVKARNCGEWKIDIRYDSRCMNQIYILDSNNNKFQICYLRKENEVLFDRTYEEIRDYYLYERQRDQSYRQDELQNSVEMNFIVKETDRQTKTAKSDIRSTRKMIKDIDENRKREKELFQDSKALIIDDPNNDTSNGVKQNNKDKNKNDSREHVLDLLDNILGG